MKNILFTLGVLTIALGSCTTSTDSEYRVDSSAIAESNPDHSHTLSKPRDLSGTYTGMLPCADCAGIQTGITLSAGKTFVKRMRYLGKKDARTFEEKGTYYQDPAGRMITLEGVNKPNQYLVGTHLLTQLDLAGNKIEGDLAQHYILKK